MRYKGIWNDRDRWPKDIQHHTRLMDWGQSFLPFPFNSLRHPLIMLPCFVNGAREPSAQCTFTATPNPHPPFHFYWKSLSTPWHSRSPHPKPFNFSGCQQGSLWSGVVPTGQQQVGTSKSVHSIEFCAWESNIGYLKAKRRRSGGCILMGGSRNPLPCWLPQLP